LHALSRDLHVVFVLHDVCGEPSTRMLLDVASIQEDGFVVGSVILWGTREMQRMSTSAATDSVCAHTVIAGWMHRSCSAKVRAASGWRACERLVVSLWTISH